VNWKAFAKGFYIKKQTNKQINYTVADYCYISCSIKVKECWYFQADFLWFSSELRIPWRLLDQLQNQKLRKNQKVQVSVKIMNFKFEQGPKNKKAVKQEKSPTL